MTSDAVTAIARSVAATAPGGRALVAIDGVGASGKTEFAGRLAQLIHDRAVVVLHADDFMQPTAIRHARGRRSPEGFWLDAYDYDALIDLALAPLRDGGSHRTHSIDHAADRAVSVPATTAPDDAVVLVEGTFLLRDELARFWDLGIYLDVPFAIARRRMAEREGAETAGEFDRYFGAQELYFRAAQPWNRASVVVDNTDFASPRIIDPSNSAAAKAFR